VEDPPSFWSTAETLLDTSVLAQSVLRQLGVPVIIPEPVLRALQRALVPA